MSYLTNNYEHFILSKREIWDIKIREREISIHLGKLSLEENKKLIQQIKKEYDTRIDNKKISVGLMSNRYYNTFDEQVTINEKDDNIIISNEKRGDNIVNYLFTKTLLKDKLIEHWTKKENIDEEEAEERIMYINTGKTKAQEIEEAKQKTLEVSLQTGIEQTLISEGKDKGKKEIEWAFMEMDQELPIRLQQKKPKDRLKARRQLEHLMWKDLSTYEKIDETKTKELTEKLAYWDTLGLDTKEPRKKITSALGELEKKIKELKKGVET